MSTAYDRQVDLEHESLFLGRRRYEAELAANGVSSTAPGKFQLKACLPALAQAVADFVNAEGTAKRRAARAAPFLSQVDPMQASYLAIRYALDAAADGSTKVNTVALRIGAAIEEHLNLLKLAGESPGLYRKVMEQVSHSPAEHIRRGVLRHVVAKYGKTKLDWSNKNKLQVGLKLIELFDETCGLIELRRNTESRHDTPVHLVLTEAAQTWMAESHERASMWQPVHLPMLVPPRPWQLLKRPAHGEWDKAGGYITRVMNRFQLLQANVAQDVPIPEPVLTAVNAIQSTPWRINRALLAVVKEAWAGGEKFRELLVEADVPMPPRPVGIDPCLQVADMNPDQRETLTAWKREASEAYAFNGRQKGKRIAVEKKLWVAEKFLEEEAIYFPHYVDFRGRIYPFASYLNPQSDDSGRAMLEFAQGKPLGERGLYWLKVHVANLFGIDKVPYAERVAWVMTNIDKLLDSAVAPLDGRMFWTEADSPWCALAAIFELAGALGFGPDYVSHLPIAMDGSCSGLQHYSAMLRDPVGGAAVNLVPAERPGDIYTEVAKRAQAVVDRSDDGAATVWKGGKVVRKIAKQPTMTLCYSATVYGMQGQIEKAVRGLGGENYLLTDDLRSACTYMAGVVWNAIGETVVAARDAMKFLKEIATLASEADIPIRWTAPSGFVVVQSYKQTEGLRVRCHYKGEELKLMVVEDGRTHDRKRQAAGVAPNFVHSLDSAHLMATVNLGTANELYDWACIHDSFGVHAADVDTLHACIRESFVEQYTPDLMAKLREEIVTQLIEAKRPELAAKVPTTPAQGALDLAAVRESAYFFA